MSLLLTPKFSLCLQNRWRVTMPAGQSSLTVQCVFFPSLKPAESFSINDSYIDMLASKTFPHYPSSVGNCPLNSLHRVLSSVVTTMEKFAVIGMGADRLLAPLSGSLSLPLPLLQLTSFSSLFCGKLGAGLEKMSEAPSLSVHLLSNLEKEEPSRNSPLPYNSFAGTLSEHVWKGHIQLLLYRKSCSATCSLQWCV